MNGLRERLARLVCVPLRDHAGEGVDELLAERASYPWGGYTVFRGELEPVRALLERLRESSERPLLLASDLERGLGQQLVEGTSFPPAMALGAAGDPRLAFEVGLATAREAAAAGLNCVFAPVLDLANEPENPIVCTRSFGDRPDRVAELGAALVRGLQEGGVLATAKHFPGHGRTRVDSHAALPVVDAGRAALVAEDLVPFRAAVEAGVALVMSAHVGFPALDPERLDGGALPATLSRPILEDLLRAELGFEGAVVSDALIMGALAGAAPGEAAARALAAGVDCLLYPPDPRGVVEDLARRVEEGSLPVEVLERAERRLGAVLARVSREAEARGSTSGVGAPEMAPHGEAVIGGAAARELALRAAAAGLVEVGDPVARLATARRALVLLLLDGAIAPADVVLPAVAAAPGREFRWLLPEREPLRVPDDLEGFDAVALAYFSPIRAWKGRAGFSAAAAALARALFAARPDTILLSFSSPFILRHLPGPPHVVLAFGEAAACQAAVGEVLAGRARPAGHLPVCVPAPANPLTGASA